MARPIVSVILSGKNEASNIAQCFESIATQKCRFPFEVHFVDNGSSDGTYAKARKQAKNYKNFYVWKEKKLGSPAAKNFGARKARGKVLVFTNLDCLPQKGWLQELASPLLKPNNYPLAAIGGSSKSEFKKPGKPNLWERYADSLYEFWEQDRTSATPAFLPWSSAANFAIKKEIFQGLGGFDENWKFAAYDVDLSWRLILCGFTMGFAPKAILTRKRKSTLRSLLRQMEAHAYYQRSLVETYERLLGLSKLAVQRKRIVDKSKQVLALLRDPKELTRINLRAAEVLVMVSAGKGSLEASLKPAKPSVRFHPTRRGETPKNLLTKLPRGYAHLHNEGWVYWKSPADIRQGGELILFQPKRRKRIRLSEMEWKIWEVKSERGQSEDAASALGEKEDNAQILHAIDELTVNLHSRRLLPAQ